MHINFANVYWVTIDGGLVSFIILPNVYWVSFANVYWITIDGVVLEKKIRPQFSIVYKFARDVLTAFVMRT